MLRNAHKIQEFFENPAGVGQRQLGKMWSKNKAKTEVLCDMLTGRYTSKTIAVEWGSQTRMDLINTVIREMGYTRYLEIGCFRDVCFSAIQATHKVGVDPVKGGTHRMTSDAFFAQNTEQFECVFIDGLHEYSQVKRDVENALACLAPGGTIMMHDCLPTSYIAQIASASLSEHWNGDTWKAAVELRTRRDVDFATCLIDHGVGMLRVRPNTQPIALPTKDCKQLTFSALADNYHGWLNPIRFEAAMQFIQKA